MFRIEKLCVRLSLKVRQTVKCFLFGIVSAFCGCSFHYSFRRLPFHLCNWNIATRIFHRFIPWHRQCFFSSCCFCFCTYTQNEPETERKIWPEKKIIHKYIDICFYDLIIKLSSDCLHHVLVALILQCSLNVQMFAKLSFSINTNAVTVHIRLSSAILRKMKTHNSQRVRKSQREGERERAESCTQ